MKIALFSGGRGTNSILKSFLTQTNFNINLIVNGYDNGLSTGRVREYIGDFLGPSDFRKNLSIILECFPEMSNQSTSKILEYRISNFFSSSEATFDKLLEDIGRNSQINTNSIPFSHFKVFDKGLNSFLNFAGKKDTFDYHDCAIGNLVFAGYFLYYNQNFNLALEKIQEELNIPSRIRIINCTDGTNAYLKALCDNDILLQNEWEIVENSEKHNINKIGLFKSSRSENIALSKETMNQFDQPVLIPANPFAMDILQTANIIIYGPGTSFSSLLPTYFTKGIAEAILDNKTNLKIYINNLNSDKDIPNNQIETAFVSMLDILINNSKSRKVHISDFVTHFITNSSESKNILFDLSINNFNISEIEKIFFEVKDWRDTESGRHLGNMVCQFVKENMHNSGEVILIPKYISIIVPCLNEVDFVEQALREIQELFDHNFPNSYEIIFVDGGSSDGTINIVESLQLPNLRIFKNSKSIGRGHAIKQGIERCRGDLICTFPSDREYSVKDLVMVIKECIENDHDAVWCSRTTQGLSVKHSTMMAYSNRKFKSFLSLWGGFMLTTLCFIRTKKIFSDPLSMVKIFKKEVLRGLPLLQSGVALEVELILGVSGAGIKTNEFPISYSPRSKEQGKKMSMLDGLSCIWYLLSFRYKK